MNRGTRSSFAPGIFLARELLQKAERGDEVTVEEGELDGRGVYVLRWREDTSKIANRVRILQTLWVDRETYAPLQMTDHAVGTDAAGRPLDQTYRATITDFERLPDTEEHRRLLKLRATPR